jgi:hypothetical protein
MVKLYRDAVRTVLASRRKHASRYLPNIYLRDENLSEIFKHAASKLIRTFNGFKMIGGTNPNYMSYLYVCQYLKDYAGPLQSGALAKKLADAFDVKLMDRAPDVIRSEYILESRLGLGMPISMLFVAVAVYAMEKTGNRSGAIKLNDLSSKYAFGGREDGLLSIEDEMEGLAKGSEFDDLVSDPVTVRLANQIVKGLTDDGHAVAATIGEAFREANYETLAGAVWGATKSFSRTGEPDVDKLARDIVKLPFVDYTPIIVGAIGFVALNSVGLQSVADIIKNHYE